MKSAVWAGLLAAITFGIGWTASQLASRRHAGDVAEAPSHRGFGGRGRMSFVGSADQLASDLDLDASQRAALSGLLEDSARRIREHEEAISAIKADARRELLELLTEDQRERLRRMFEDRLRRRMEENVAQGVEWFRAHADLDAERLARIERILVDYESSKRRHFDDWCGDEGAARVPIEERRAERDRRLAEVVGEEMLEQYKRDRGSRRRSGRSGGDSMNSSENQP